MDGAVWDLCAQLCIDLKAMPVEDASVPWPEDQSPYVPVGRITAQAQDAWSRSNITRVDEGMSFNLGMDLQRISLWDRLCGHARPPSHAR